VLLTQSKTATNDINVLERTKARAMADPQEFLRALGAGEITTRGDPLFNPSAAMEEEEDSDEDDERKIDGEMETGTVGKTPWEPLPAPQTVVRAPPVRDCRGIVGQDSCRSIGKTRGRCPGSRWSKWTGCISER